MARHEMMEDTETLFGEYQFYQKPNTVLPTLKQSLSNLPHIYAKLDKLGMNDIETFLFITENELEGICGESGFALTFMEGVKFKSVVRKLQQQFAPKKVPHFVQISKAEQMALDGMNHA
eukprot:107869_1